MQKLLLLIALCLFPISGTAKSSVVIAKGTHCILSRTLGDYGITISSVSQFDAPITIELGKDKETAIKNLEKIIQLYDKTEEGKDAIYIIGLRTYRLKRIPLAFNVGHQTYGGDVNITKTQLEKFLKALRKYAED